MRLSEFSKPCILLGDFNGKKSDYNNLLLNRGDMSYPVQNTKGRNINGDFLQVICKKNKLVILNNVKAGNKTFTGDWTFRKKEQWISEIDLYSVPILNTLYLTLPDR